MASRPPSPQLELDFGAVESGGRPDFGQGGQIAWLKRLRDAYLAGMFGGTVHEVYPEVEPGSRENYLYFTLAPALNFQRSSEGLWRAAFATYEDPGTRFVFFPENTETASHDSYKDALVTHRLALQPQKHSDIWYRISSTLREEFESDPRVLLRTFGFDVARIKEYVQANKKAFPYISGPKLLNYWLYMLLSFTDVPLVSREEISIIPDVHVCRASARLGLVPQETEPNPERVAAAWKELLTGSGIAPCDLHAPLWRWSRAGFPALPRS
jgi:hypothetical protein